MAENQTQTGVKQQFSRFVARLSTGQKVLIVGVALVSVAAIILLVSTIGSEPMSVLFSELEAKDASLITEKLRESQIAYELVDKGRTIMVPGSRLHETRLTLASEGLPQSSVVGYEIFDEANLGMSDFVQKLNYRRALEGELSRSIMSLEEVEKARVHIVIPEKALFERDQKEPTASVVLHLKSGRRVSRVNVEGVQNLVASSVEGMASNAVKVMDQKARVLSAPVKDTESLAGLSSTQYEQKQKVDNYLSSKVQSLLDRVIGMEKSVVRVDAELDFTRKETTVEDFDPDRQVIRSEQIKTESNVAKDSLNYPAVNSEAQMGNTITNYEISKTVEKIVSGVGAIRRMTVAVLVDGTYQSATDADGNQSLEYVPRTEDDINQLRQIVRNAVGYDPARNDQISVVNIPFDTDIDIITETPDFFGVPVGEEQVWKIVLIVAMIIAVLMIWRLIASPQVRRRIEQVLAPSDLEKQRIELAKAAAERQQQLLKNLTESSDFLALPEVAEKDVSESARQRLEMMESPDSAEETAYRKEMKERVVGYLSDYPEEASRLLKSMLRQDSSEILKRLSGG